MTIAFRAQSNPVYATGSTSLSPAIPTGTTTGDIMIMWAHAKPFSATFNDPSGWTRLDSGASGSTNNANGSGSVVSCVWYREWQSGDTAPTITVTNGDSSLATIISFSRTLTAWETPVAGLGGNTTSSTTISFTFTGLDSGTITSGDFLAYTVGVCDDANTHTTPRSLTATGATIGTITAAANGTNTTGFDTSSWGGYASVTAGTSTATLSGSFTVNTAEVDKMGVAVRLRESNNQTVVANLVSATTTIFQSTILPGNVDVGSNLVAAATAVYNAEVAQTVTANLVAASPSVFNPDISAGGAVGAQLVSATTTIYQATVVPGDVSIDANLVSAAPTVYNLSVLQAVAADLVTASPTVYSANVNQSVAANLVSASTTVYQPTVAQIAPNHADISWVEFEVPVPDYDFVLAERVANPPVVFTASVEQAVVADLVSAGTQVFAANITQAVVATAVAVTPTVYGPTVIPGVATVNPPAIGLTFTVQAPDVIVGPPGPITPDPILLTLTVLTPTIGFIPPQIVATELVDVVARVFTPGTIFRDLVVNLGAPDSGVDFGEIASRIGLDAPNGRVDPDRPSKRLEFGAPTKRTTMGVPQGD